MGRDEDLVADRRSLLHDNVSGGSYEARSGTECGRTGGTTTALSNGSSSLL